MRWALHRLAWLTAAPLVAAVLLPARAMAASAPQNTSPPSISTVSGDEPAVGETLTANPGTWTGSPAPTYAYEWYECNSSGNGCVDTTHSGTQYQLGDADYGHEMEVLVTGTNGSGSQSVMSARVYIAGSSPTLVAAPALSGGTAVGDTLTVSSGTWSGYPTPQVYAYTWWDCVPGTANGDSSGCTQNTSVSSNSSTYTLTSADVGYEVQAAVYVDNGRHASAWSNVSAVVTVAPPASRPAAPGAASPAPGAGTVSAAGSLVTPAVVGVPQRLSAPTVTGTVGPGRVLRASPGRWSDHPTAYHYAWLACGPLGACMRISGATATRYTVRLQDAGRRLIVQVVAANSAGVSAPARSSATHAVIAVTTAQMGRALARLAPLEGRTFRLTGSTLYQGYAAIFVAPGTGRLSIRWTASVAGRRYLIAAASARYAHSGPSRILIRLTAAGARLLAHHPGGRWLVVSSAVFTTSHQRPRRLQRTFSVLT